MPISSEDISENLRHIKIDGRLDILGTDEIANKFAVLSAVEKKSVIVDLTGVTFLASIGIRALITNAKALHNRGGKMVLLVGNNAAVIKTLESTGIDTILPMYVGLDEAKAVMPV